MWYQIDFVKLCTQLLPPILRSRFLVALLSVMIVPLRHIYNEFRALKDTVDSRLNITGNVMYLEKALNEAFYLVDRQIYIETPEERETPTFYFATEKSNGNTFWLQSEGDGFILTRKGESKVPVNFIVRVPTFLCTSLETRDADKYGWRFLVMIKNILNIYKPAGRTFSIELYDYE